MIRKVTSTIEPLFYDFRKELEDVCMRHNARLELSDSELFISSYERDIQRICSCFDNDLYEDIEKVVNNYF